MDEQGVTFKWKDYRRKEKSRHQRMTLTSHEFMRRFLLHVLPGGFHRIRHYGLSSNTGRKKYLAQARELLRCKELDTLTDAGTNRVEDTVSGEEPTTFICQDCGGPMIIIEVFVAGQLPRGPPAREGES